MTFASGEPVALAVADGIGAALVGDAGGTLLLDDPAFDRIAEIERDIGPRWVWWTGDTATTLVGHGIRPARCSNLEAVHRLLMGGWRAGPGRVWAAHRGLDPLPDARRTPPDLFSPPDDDDPIRSDGHLNPAWIDGRWRTDLAHLHRWAVLALEVHRRQQDRLEGLADRPAAAGTARSESAATLLCAELEHDGLPVDVDEAERIIASFIGPRPLDAADDRRITDERDRRVLRHLGGRTDTTQGIDLRSPASVKSLLRRIGIEVPDTRAWRLEQIRDEHPLVEDLLEWRRAERIATTFGYRWLDQHVGTDGRLRGRWSSSDGAAGRMTATAGLHNLPAELRPAVVAEHGHIFLRADLGQIEPRILAAISGDAALTAATVDDDMYAPVAARLGVSREIAKVAVLGAMYGQTTGHGATALRGLEREYPVAMAYLDRSARRAESGQDLRTVGGRLVRMSSESADLVPDPETAAGADADQRASRSRAAARGRYGRNAMVQGAAAEFFKTWAVIVRARLAGTGAVIVLCLHDELLVHAPVGAANAARESLDDGLQEAAHRWEPAGDVRFVTETSVITRWSDAK
jgi:DNA polymerase-1